MFSLFSLAAFLFFYIEYSLAIISFSDFYEMQRC